MAEHRSTGIRNVVLLGAAAALTWSVVLPDRLQRPVADVVPPVALAEPPAPALPAAPAVAPPDPAPARATSPVLAVSRPAPVDRPAVIEHLEATASLLATVEPTDVELAVTPPPVAQATVTSASVTAASPSVVSGAAAGTRSPSRGRGGKGHGGSGSPKGPDAAAAHDVRWAVPSGRGGAKSDDDHGPTHA